MIECKCPQCGAPFMVKSELSDRKFCSQECWARTQRRVERPSREELALLVEKLPVRKIAAAHNVTDVAVRKWCKAYEIKTKPRGYWAKVQAKEHAAGESGGARVKRQKKKDAPPAKLDTSSLKSINEKFAPFAHLLY